MNNNNIILILSCSAGVGCTGTFIVIDNILEQIEKEQVVDIPGAITKIRQRRMKMVPTHVRSNIAIYWSEVDESLDPHNVKKDQFMFIHDAILESVTCGDTQITATDLKMTVEKMKRNDNKKQLHGFHYQFKVSV